MSAELQARLEAAERRLQVVEGLLKPQTLRDHLERTFDPRGGEPRIITPSGVTLDYAPSLQFTGGADVTLNAPERRIEIGITEGATAGQAGVVWLDTFATDQLATHYSSVSNFAVSGGVLTATQLTTAVAVANTPNIFNGLQWLKIVAPSTIATAPAHSYQLAFRLGTHASSVAFASWVPLNGTSQGTLFIGAGGQTVVTTTASNAWRITTTGGTRTAYFVFGVSGSSMYATVSKLSPMDAAFGENVGTTASEFVMANATSASGLACAAMLGGPRATRIAEVQRPSGEGWQIDEYGVVGT